MKTMKENEIIRKLQKELRIGYWARRLFERLTDKQVDTLFEIVKAGGIDRELLNARDIAFDWHSAAILRLLGFKIVAGAIGTIKLPFRSGRV